MLYNTPKLTFPEMKRFRLLFVQSVVFIFVINWCYGQTDQTQLQKGNYVVVGAYHPGSEVYLNYFINSLKEKGIEPKTGFLDGKVAVIADPTGAAVGLLEWQEGMLKGGR